MNAKKITIAGAGCAIADLIYNRVSFDSPEFQKFCSKQTGDGGLSIGKLVFIEELEIFSGKSYPEILGEIVGIRPPDAMNVGGPSLVALIHAAQMLDKDDFEVEFYGMAGKDEYAKQMLGIISQTPLSVHNYKLLSSLATPTTYVFSDPDFDFGHGERTFVNNIGAAWDYTPEQIGEEFFQADIQCFGGTALVPRLHDNLSMLLNRSKQKECITVVNTIFDFRNEKINPKMPWPLLDSLDDYSLIDVLIMDCEEALRISGTKSIDEAAASFSKTKISSFIITNGANNLLTWSNGKVFQESPFQEFPVSRMIAREIKTKPEMRGDTTGCGDNFAGGIITSLAMQLKNTPKGKFSLSEAISWGISSGGFCCFTVGGTYLEEFPGAKRMKILAIMENYMKQLNDN